MKKIYLFVVLWLSLLGNASAGLTPLGVPPGFVGGTSGDFTFSGHWGNVGGSVAFISFYSGETSTLTFNAGSFDFGGINLNGRPWDGYNDHFPGGTTQNPLLTLTFKDISGNVIATGNTTLAATNAFSTYSQYVAGVHMIEFSAPTSQFFVRVASITMVPELHNYMMLLVGGVVGAVCMKRKRIV